MSIFQTFTVRDNISQQTKEKKKTKKNFDELIKHYLPPRRLKYQMRDEVIIKNKTKEKKKNTTKRMLCVNNVYMYIVQFKLGQSHRNELCIYAPSAV